MDKFITRSTPDLRTSSAKRTQDEASVKWIHPKRFAIAKPSDENVTATSNRFSGLQVDGEVQVAFKSATTKKAVGRIPPIVIELFEDMVHQKLMDTIEKYDKNYYLQYKGSNRVKIQCLTTDAHQAIKSGLINENFSFHTFTRRDEKRPKVVIKGLPENISESLATDLESLGFPGASVSQIKTMKPVQCPPMLVLLPNGTDMNRFKQIKFIANCAVVIQRYKTTNKLGTQCYRCQGFGHASRNCNRSARCVKCSLEHPTSECPETGFIETVRCCNCQKNHPANYSQCSERLKYLDRIKSKRDQLRISIANTQPGPKRQLNVIQDEPLAKTSTIKAYQPPANVKAPLPPPATQAKTFDPSNVPAQSTGVSSTPSCDAATNEMLQILAAIKNLKQQFIKCESLMDKVILILSHLGHYF